jgi:hypothetical protein
MHLFYDPKLAPLFGDFEKSDGFSAFDELR